MAAGDPSGGGFTLEYQLTETEVNDLLSSMSDYTRRATTRWMVVLAVPGILLIVSGVPQLSGAGGVISVIIGGLMLAVGVLTRVQAVAQFIKVMRQNGRLGDLEVRHRVEVGPGGVGIATPRTLIFLRWTAVQDFRAAGDLLLLSLSDLQVIGLPTRALPDGVSVEQALGAMTAWQQAGTPPTDAPLSWAAHAS